jgi:hypothetical protein
MRRGVGDIEDAAGSLEILPRCPGADGEKGDDDHRHDGDD